MTDSNFRVSDESDSADRSLSELTSSGSAWSIGSGLVAQSVQFAVGIYLARLLRPEHFGQLAMVLVFVGFAEIATHSGFGVALVQREDLRESHRSSSFWFQSMVGLVLSVLFYVGAPLIDFIYDQADLILIIQSLSIVFLISGLYGTQEALLRRRMKFRRLAYIKIASTFITGVISIVLALRGWGIWSLVAFHLGLNVFEGLLFIPFCHWQPKLTFRLKALRQLFNFSLSYLGARVFNYWVRTADDFLLGKFLGSSPLGLYTKAYAFVTFPYRKITNRVEQAVLPALSHLQSDFARLKSLYFRSVRMIGYAVFPMLLGFSVVADEFTVGILGPQWRGIIPLLRILIIFGLIRAVVSTMKWPMLATGRSDVNFWWQLIGGSLMIGGFTVGLLWGVSGVAWGLVIASSVSVLPGLVLLRRVIDIRPDRLFRRLFPSLVASSAMAVTVWLFGEYALSGLTDVLSLVVQVSIGFVVYWGLSFAFQLEGYLELKRFLTNGS